MKKSLKSFTVLLLIITCAGSICAREIADFFIEAPTATLPLSRPTARMDMLDYYNSGSRTGVSNSLGGSSFILEKSAERLVVKASGASTVEYDMIVNGADTLIAVITTVATPQPDSRIDIYRADTWELTPSQPQMPGIKDFLKAGASLSQTDNSIPYFFCSATYNSERGIFVFTNTTPSYFHPSDTPAELELLTDSLRMKWDGKKWKKMP